MATRQFDVVFVTYTDAPEKAHHDPRVKEVVRKQARKARRFRQTDSTSNTDASSNSGTSSNDNSPADERRRYIHRFKVHTNKPPFSDISAGNTEAPLRKLPALDPTISSIGPRAWSLLEYCRLAPRMQTMSTLENSEWFALAQHNTSISLATLCLASLNRDREYRLPASPLTIHYRVLSIRCLHRELEQYASSGLQREIMAGTVAILILVEDLEGNCDASKSHINGLTRLIRMRGGLLTFSSSEPLMNLIAWSTLCHSSAWLTDISRTSNTAGSFGDTSHLTDQDPQMREELVKILCPYTRGLVDLLRTFQTAIVPGYHTLYESTLVLKVLLIAERLILTIKSRIPSEGSPYALARAFVCSCHLYYCIAFLELPLNSQKVSTHVEHLRHELQTYELHCSVGGEHRTSNICLLWVQAIALISGLNVREGSDQDGLRIGQLLGTARQLHIDSYDSFMAMLGRICWADKIIPQERLGAWIQTVLAVQCLPQDRLRI